MNFEQVERFLLETYNSLKKHIGYAELAFQILLSKKYGEGDWKSGDIAGDYFSRRNLSGAIENSSLVAKNIKEISEKYGQEAVELYKIAVDLQAQRLKILDKHNEFAKQYKENPSFATDPDIFNSISRQEKNVADQLQKTLEKLSIEEARSFRAIDEYYDNSSLIRSYFAHSILPHHAKNRNEKGYIGFEELEEVYYEVGHHYKSVIHSLDMCVQYYLHKIRVFSKDNTERVFSKYFSYPAIAEIIQQNKFQDVSNEIKEKFGEDVQLLFKAMYEACSGYYSMKQVYDTALDKYRTEGNEATFFPYRKDDFKPNLESATMIFSNFCNQFTNDSRGVLTEKACNAFYKPRFKWFSNPQYKQENTQPTDTQGLSFDSNSESSYAPENNIDLNSEAAEKRKNKKLLSDKTLQERQKTAEADQKFQGNYDLEFKRDVIEIIRDFPIQTPQQLAAALNDINNSDITLGNSEDFVEDHQIISEQLDDVLQKRKTPATIEHLEAFLKNNAEFIKINDKGYYYLAKKISPNPIEKIAADLTNNEGFIQLKKIEEALKSQDMSFNRQYVLKQLFEAGYWLENHYEVRSTSYLKKGNAQIIKDNIHFLLQTLEKTDIYTPQHAILQILVSEKIQGYGRFRKTTPVYSQIREKLKTKYPNERIDSDYITTSLQELGVFSSRGGTIQLPPGYAYLKIAQPVFKKVKTIAQFLKEQSAGKESLSASEIKAIFVEKGITLTHSKAQQYATDTKATTSSSGNEKKEPEKLSDNLEESYDTDKLQQFIELGQSSNFYLPENIIIDSIAVNGPLTIEAMEAIFQNNDISFYYQQIKKIADTLPLVQIDGTYDLPPKFKDYKPAWWGMCKLYTPEHLVLDTLSFYSRAVVDVSIYNFINERLPKKFEMDVPAFLHEGRYALTQIMKGYNLSESFNFNDKSEGSLKEPFNQAKNKIYKQLFDKYGRAQFILFMHDNGDKVKGFFLDNKLPLISASDHHSFERLNTLSKAEALEVPSFFSPIPVATFAQKFKGPYSLELVQNIIEIIRDSRIYSPQQIVTALEKRKIKMTQQGVLDFLRINEGLIGINTADNYRYFLKERIQSTTTEKGTEKLSNNLKESNNSTKVQDPSSGSNSGSQNSANQNPYSESSHTLEKDVEKLTQSKYAKVLTDPVKRLDQHNKLVQKLRDIQRRHGLDEKQFKKLYKLVTSPNLDPDKKIIKEILTRKTKKEAGRKSKTFEVFAPEKQASTIEWAYPAAYPFEQGVKGGPSLEKTTLPSRPPRAPVTTLIAGLGVPPVFLPSQQRPFSVRARYWVRHNFVHNPLRMQKLAFLSKGAGYVNLGFLGAHVTKDLIHLPNGETRTQALKSLGYTGAGVAGFYSLSRVAPLTATYLGIGFAGLNMVTIAIPTAIIGYAIADGISEKVAPFMVAYAKGFEAPKYDCAVHSDPFFTPDRFYQHQASKRPVFKVEASPKSDLYFTTRKADWDPNKFMVYIGKESHASLTDNLVTQVTKDKALQVTSYVVLPYATTKPEKVIIEGKSYQWAYYNPASAVTGDTYWTASKEEAQAGIEALNKSQVYTVGCSCHTQPLIYPYGLNEPTKGAKLTIQDNKVQLTNHADKTLTSFVQEINTYRQQQDRAELKIPYAFFYIKSLPMLKPLFPGYDKKTLMAQE